MSLLQVGALVEDLSVYPRHAVDDGHVAALVNALKAGATLPPVVAETGTLRLVDGFHRTRAYLRTLGPEGVIEVEEITYTDEGQLLLDAIRRNSAHGRKMDVVDHVRAIALAQQRGIDLLQVGLVLNLPAERVKKLSVRLANTEIPAPGNIPGSLSVALKRPVQHLQGQVLTPAQAAAHQSAPGWSYLLISQQIKQAIEVGFINRGDTVLMEALGDLHGALGAFLAA